GRDAFEPGKPGLDAVVDVVVRLCGDVLGRAPPPAAVVGAVDPHERVVTVWQVRIGEAAQVELRDVVPFHGAALMAMSGIPRAPPTPMPRHRPAQLSWRPGEPITGAAMCHRLTNAMHARAAGPLRLGFDFHPPGGRRRDLPDSCAVGRTARGSVWGACSAACSQSDDAGLPLQSAKASNSTRTRSGGPSESGSMRSVCVSPGGVLTKCAAREWSGPLVNPDRCSWTHRTYSSQLIGTSTSHDTRALHASRVIH